MNRSRVEDGRDQLRGKAKETCGRPDRRDGPAAGEAHRIIRKHREHSGRKFDMRERGE